jgi:hypothetical protein
MSNLFLSFSSSSSSALPVFPIFSSFKIFIILNSCAHSSIVILDLLTGVANYIISSADDVPNLFYHSFVMHCTLPFEMPVSFTIWSMDLSSRRFCITSDLSFDNDGGGGGVCFGPCAIYSFMSVNFYIKVVKRKYKVVKYRVKSVNFLVKLLLIFKI